MRRLFLYAVNCALLSWGAVSVPAQPFALSATPANVAHWMYPFNQSPANRPTASTFAAFGNLGTFDTRDGQYLIGWNLSNSVPTGQGPRNYLLSRVTVTLTISSDMYYAYDGTLRDYRTYFPVSDPRYLPTTAASSPIELYGAGFRSGFTNSNGIFVPYSATNFPQNGPFFASSTGGDYTNRVAYAACYNTNGVLVDVSDNVADNGTTEITNPFEVAPFAIGCNPGFTPGQLMPADSQLVFELNLDDPLIYGYVQQGLNQGNLSFMVSSLVNANYFSGTPNWPDFYTLFDVLADADEYPLIDVEGTVVRTSVDTDADGLPDDWEQFYFGSLGEGANLSANNDGVSNLSKYLAGTNPTNSANNLQLLSIQGRTGSTELHFNFAASRQYAIQWSTNLANWQTVTNPSLNYLSAWLTKTGTNVAYPAPVYAVWQDTNAMNAKKFYRVSVQ